jgi:LPPG:FO 2-phospho-L-lactate transferase
LKEGESLSHITRDFCKVWGIGHTILPMSDQPVRTIVETDEGELAFQEYFVHRRCEPRVKGFRFEGVDIAEPAPGAREAIQSADAVVICPSNPWVSVDPILQVIQKIEKPVYAISPIIGGETIKGPAAKMYRELGVEPSALAVANHYRGLVRGFVLDKIDTALGESVRALNVQTLIANTIMRTSDDRKQLAMEAINFIGATV